MASTITLTVYLGSDEAGKIRWAKLEKSAKKKAGKSREGSMSRVIQELIDKYL